MRLNGSIQTDTPLLVDPMSRQPSIRVLKTCRTLVASSSSNDRNCRNFLKFYC